MADATPPNPVVLNPNETWRGFTKRAPIDTCRLRDDDFKRLYRIINEKQREYGERIVTGLFQTQEETPEQFQIRYAWVKNAFITTVAITGMNGDVITGHGENFFDSPLIPEHIKSIFYDTSFSPNAQLKHMPTDRVSVLLDFSRPPLLNLGSFASAPTLNESNWSVSAASESWFTSLCTRLQEFFAQRSTGVGWLHLSGIYDALLLAIGFPLALWGAYRLGNILTISSTFSAVLNTAIYIYIFFFLLNVFRVLFSYSRWAFPRLELESNKSAALRQRAVLYTIVVSILGRAVWEAIRALF